MSQAFNTLAGRLVDKLSAGLSQTSASTVAPNISPAPFAPGSTEKSPVQEEIELDAALLEAANSLSVANQRLVPGLEAQNLDDAWDDWINGSLGPIHSRGMEDTGEVDMDTLLATIGGSSGWFNAMVETTQGQAVQQGQAHQSHHVHPLHPSPTSHQTHQPYRQP